jgi:PAS domain S-box-containing protein
LSHIINATRDGYLKVNRDGKVESANAVYANKSGYSLDELVGMEMSDLDALGVSAETAERTRRIIEQGSELFESVHRRKDGTLWPVEASVIFENINGGQLISFIRDLTVRNRFESETLATNERLAAILNSLPDLLFEIDEEGHILNCHTQNAQLLLLSPKIFLGKTFVEVLPSHAAEVCSLAIREAEDLGIYTGRQYSLDLPD